MIGSTKKRFWKDASVTESDGGFEVLLDNRHLRSPAKSALVLPTRSLAEAISREWQVQKDVVDPASMPMTRRANAAVDKVTAQRREVAAMLGEYGASDLLCYRAEQPEELIARQANAWTPILEWAEAEFAVHFEVTKGVIPVSQNESDVKKLADEVAVMEPFALTGFHDLVTVSGSLIIALAAIRHAFEPDDLWARSQIDEIWQSEVWGQDTEAMAAAAAKRQDFLDAFRFFGLVT